jgi:Ankyrin repeats (3 copies)
MLTEEQKQIYLELSKRALGQLIMAACRNQDAETVYFLIKETELSNKKEISSTLRYAFGIACEVGSLEIVSLLTEEFPNITKGNSDFFTKACRNKHYPVIHHLLNEIENPVPIGVAFLNACEAGNVSVVSNILTQTSINIQENDNEALFLAFKSGNDDLVKYMLTSDELITHADPHAKNDELLMMAGKYRRIDLIEYLLNTPELNISIHTQDDQLFVNACDNDNFELVQFLLTSPKLSEHADIHAQQEQGLTMACGGDNKKLVDYLINSPELKEKADINAHNGKAFVQAVDCLQEDMVKYLILQIKQLDETQVSSWCGNDYNVNKLLSVRKIKGFHEKLDTQLEPKNDDSRKMKI